MNWKINYGKLIDKLSIYYDFHRYRMKMKTALSAMHETWIKIK